MRNTIAVLNSCHHRNKRTDPSGCNELLAAAFVDPRTSLQTFHACRVNLVLTCVRCCHFPLRHIKTSINKLPLNLLVMPPSLFMQNILHSVVVNEIGREIFVINDQTSIVGQTLLEPDMLLWNFFHFLSTWISACWRYPIISWILVFPWNMRSAPFGSSSRPRLRENLHLFWDENE